jgi:hypothetical protein
MPHIIRLREPWERERLADGSLRLMRRFHRPTGLDETSRVWLVVENLDGAAEVSLNDRVLGRLSGGQKPSDDAVTKAQARIEITQSLRPHNMIAIVAGPALAGKEEQANALNSVRLEIEDGEA